MTTMVLDDLSEAARRRLFGERATVPRAAGAQPVKASASAPSTRSSTQYRGRRVAPRATKPT